MKVKELISKLRKQNPNAKIFLSSDAEGNVIYSSIKIGADGKRKNYIPSSDEKGNTFLGKSIVVLYGEDCDICN